VTIHRPLPRAFFSPPPLAHRRAGQAFFFLPSPPFSRTSFFSLPFLLPPSKESGRGSPSLFFLPQPFSSSPLFLIRREKDADLFFPSSYSLSALFSLSSFIARDLRPPAFLLSFPPTSNLFFFFLFSFWYWLLGYFSPPPPSECPSPPPFHPKSGLPDLAFSFFSPIFLSHLYLLPPLFSSLGQKPEKLK